MNDEQKAANLFNTLKRHIKTMPFSVQIKIAGTSDFEKLPAEAQDMMVKVVEELEL